MSVRHLARTNSYHHPIILRCSTKENEGSEGHTGNKPFRVLEAWYSYKSFSELVQNAWAGNHHDLINSMKMFSHNASIWNKRIFGNIIVHKKDV